MTTLQQLAGIPTQRAANGPPSTARGQVAWRDLVKMGHAEVLWEFSLSLPWLAASLAAYQAGWWWAGMLGSFFFFLTGLRQSHNAQHYAITAPRWTQDGLLLALSVLMMDSMHAVQVTHMHHHRHCLDDEDVEAGHANLPWWRVVLTGPAFPVLLLRAAWCLGSIRKRIWVAAEVALMGLAAVLIVRFGAMCLRWHLAAMTVGECFTGFFAVWTVHHGCDDQTIARTQRGWWKNFVSYSMFYHLEHHLFPAVPTCHLPELARRLDAATPTEVRKMVF